MNDHNNADQNQTAGDPLIFADAPKDGMPAEPATERQVQQAESKIEERMSAFERSMLRLTIAAVVISIVTGLIFAGQLYEMHEGGAQTDKMIDAANRNAAAAKGFADSAGSINTGIQGAVGQMQGAVSQLRTMANSSQKSIKATQNAMRQDQRAWVGVMDASVVEFNENEVPKVVIVFSNSGKTPARNVQVSVRFRLSETPIAGPLPEDIKALEYRPAQSIPPQGKFNFALGFDVMGRQNNSSELNGDQFLRSRFAAIKAKSLILYYFGILKYDDVFGKHRETQFCLAVADPEKKEISYCDNFNDLN